MITITQIVDSEPISMYFELSNKIKRSVWNEDTNQILLTQKDWAYLRSVVNNPKEIKKIVDGCQKVKQLSLET